MLECSPVRILADRDDLVHRAQDDRDFGQPEVWWIPCRRDWMRLDQDIIAVSTVPNCLRCVSEP